MICKNCGKKFITAYNCDDCRQSEIEALHDSLFELTLNSGLVTSKADYYHCWYNGSFKDSFPEKIRELCNNKESEKSWAQIALKNQQLYNKEVETTKQLRIEIDNLKIQIAEMQEKSVQELFEILNNQDNLSTHLAFTASIIEKRDILNKEKSELETKFLQLKQNLNAIRQAIVKNAPDTLWFDESTTIVDYIDFCLEEIIQNKELLEQKPAN